MKLSTTGLACLLLAASLGGRASAAPPADPPTRLTLSDPDGRDLGRSLALDGNRLLAGAPEHADGEAFGRAVVFLESGGTWTEEQTLTPLGPSRSFGRVVALSRHVAVVGGRSEAGRGRAWIFEYDGTGWTQTAELASDSIRRDAFGTALACSSDRVAVGAPRYSFTSSAGIGRVYVYARTPAGWQLETRLEGDAVTEDAFGAALALDGERMLVGSPYHSYGPGAAFVFVRGASGWALEQRFASQTAPPDIHFGRYLDLDGQDALVGGQQAYVFRRAGSTWVERPALDDGVHDPGPLALSGTRAVVAPSVTPGALVGLRVGATWSEQAQLFAPAEDEQALDFGRSVAIDGERIAVGDPRRGPLERGAVYLFERPVGTPGCAAVAGSAGLPAHMFGHGTPSLLADDLLLGATPVPDGPGLFLAGTLGVQVPFGAGYRCVGGTVVRLGASNGAAGHLQKRLDLSGSAFTPGSTWHFQAWFRDEAAAPGAFQTSTSLSVRVVP